MSDARIPDRTERNAATSFRDNAAGPPVEGKAVTGRPTDTPAPNTTFAQRAKAARPTTKAVEGDETENKAVSSSRARSKDK